MRDFEAILGAGEVDAPDSRSRNGESEPTAATPAELRALYCALVDADDQGDAPALGRLGWSLFTMASATQQAHWEAVSLLDELRAAARAAIAGAGSSASLALLRHVLTKHGGMPPPGATPLEVLSAPPGRGMPRARGHSGAPPAT
jgi:hypothetical protein